MQRKETPRFALVDGLRAVAACSVLAFHSANNVSTTFAGGYVKYTVTLQDGVAVFFAISGFLLYRPFALARRGSGTVSTADYLRRRILRIVPAYWFALTVLAVTAGLQDVLTGHWWVYYLFAQVYSSRTLEKGLSVAWTLDVEVVFYLVLPLLAAGLTRLCRRIPGQPHWRIDLMVLVTLSVMSNVFRSWAWVHAPTLTATFFADFDWLAAGMLIATVSVALGDRSVASFPSPLRTTARHPVLAWAGAVGLMFIQARFISAQTLLLHPQQIGVIQIGIYHWLELGVAVLALLPAVFGAECRGATRRLLGLPLVMWLGTISYGIYLWHLPIILWLDDHGVLSVPGSRLINMTASAFGLAVICATFSYYVIEQPLQRRLGRRAAAPRAVDPATRSGRAGRNISHL